MHDRHLDEDDATWTLTYPDRVKDEDILYYVIEISIRDWRWLWLRKRTIQKIGNPRQDT